MGVCAESDVTDDEIIEVCNRENISGTTGGWQTVIRKHNPDGWLQGNTEPITCADDPKRTHFLIEC